ncbi:MAG TPA: peptidylprolyl isomerase [Candidatus Cloacimonadota bacterium]|nr:peptidylprolyl isomerase [Candidatus Cloacimonadota bacterium]
MKRFILMMLALCLFISFASAELVDRIVAKVGGEIILLSDIQKMLLQMRAAGLDVEKVTPAEILQELIEQRLILQKAKELDIRLNEDSIRKYAENYIKQLKSQYPSEAEFRQDLAKSQTTENELLEYYIDKLRENALTEQLVERFVSAKAVVSETEMRNFYEAHKDSLAVRPITWETGMILKNIKASQKAENQKLSEIRAIYQRIMNGEDFAAVASTDSDCPSKARGGDLGFFSKGMMVKPFEDAAFTLNVGEVSDIVKTQFGYHIIKLEEKRANELRARHILKIIEPTMQDTVQTRELMENVRERLIQGESLATLASEVSDDEQSKAEGGIVGEYDADGMPEFFRAAIMATPVGEPTAVLENEGTLYIFIRTKEIPSRLYSYDEVKDSVGALLAREKQIEAYGDWIKELMEESYVEIVQ